MLRRGIVLWGRRKGTVAHRTRLPAPYECPSGATAAACLSPCPSRRRLRRKARTNSFVRAQRECRVGMGEGHARRVTACPRERRYRVLHGVRAVRVAVRRTDARPSAMDASFTYAKSSQRDGEPDSPGALRDLCGERRNDGAAAGIDVPGEVPARAAFRDAAGRRPCGEGRRIRRSPRSP